MKTWLLLPLLSVPVLSGGGPFTQNPLVSQDLPGPTAVPDLQTLKRHLSTQKDPTDQALPVRFLVDEFLPSVNLFPTQQQVEIHVKVRETVVDPEKIFRVRFRCGHLPRMDRLKVVGKIHGEEATTRPPSYVADSKAAKFLLDTGWVKATFDSVTVKRHFNPPIIRIQEGVMEPMQVPDPEVRAFCEQGVLKLDSSGLVDASNFTFLANPVVEFAGNTFAHRYFDGGDFVLLHVPVESRTEKAGPVVTEQLALNLQSEDGRRSYRVVGLTRVRKDVVQGKRKYHLLHGGKLYAFWPHSNPSEKLAALRFASSDTLTIYSAPDPQRNVGWLKTVFNLQTQVVYTVPARKPAGEVVPAPESGLVHLQGGFKGP